MGTSRRSSVSRERVSYWCRVIIQPLLFLGAKHNLETKGDMGLQISIRESGGVTILDLRGRATINGGETELLSSHLQELVASSVRKLLLNLRDLNQVDSSGVSVIVRTYVSLRGQGADLKLLSPGGRVLEVFRVLRLLEIIPSFEDEAEALASFPTRGNYAKL